MANATCLIPDCEAPVKNKLRGWCDMHYHRWRNHGDPLIKLKSGPKVGHRKQSPEERFWAKVNKAGPIPEHRPDLGPCWIWTGAIRSGGYGVFWVNSRLGVAPRYAYELLIGPIPDDKETDHLCRVRACVNPAHLEPVTHAENVRRGLGPLLVASRQREKTHCPKGHPYDEANTYWRPDGGRDCRTCMGDRARRHRARAKE